MSRKQVKDMAASVRQRLLTHSRDQGESFGSVLTRYALERFLYRLSVSDHADKFILKGAFRFMAWTEEVHRPTKDLDLLAFGENSEARLRKVISQICGVIVEPGDGLVFDLDEIKVDPIRDEQAYQGVRVVFQASLDSATIRLQLDIGFGDAVTPAPEMIDYPALLNMPSPKIMAYPKESVVAEKLEAMVSLGMANSRMKDFYDLWIMSRVFVFDEPILSEAIRNTFQRRGTPLPDSVPIALTGEFAQDADKAAQWKAFISKNQLSAGDGGFAGVIADLRHFLLPPLQALADQAMH